ncbi:MAG: arginine deiminase family protein [Thermoplasmata archaeon]
MAQLKKIEIGAQSMYSKLETVLIKKAEDAFISQKYIDENYKKYNYVGRPIMKNLKRDYESFESILRDHVKNIYYLPKDPASGIDSVYTHDTLKVTEKGAIYFQMGKVLRRNEPALARKYLESIGVPTLGSITGTGTMEGGDVVWVDPKTVAIGLGYRTNAEAIRQFEKITKGIVREVITVQLPHADGKERVLHLQSLISIIDRDLVVMYSRYLSAFLREYLIERGFNIIEVSDDEYLTMGTNVLALSPRKCVMLKGNKNVKKSIEEYGGEVFEYDGMDLSMKGEGGPTCMTAPLFRL